MALQLIIVLASALLVTGQRPSFAGTRPIGFPELIKRTTTTTAEGLGDRFGVDSTTQRLPIEALGDRDLVDRLSKLPIDQQPFWLINWRALEEHRKNPQTYPSQPGSFVNRFPPNNVNSNTDLGDRNSGTNLAGPVNNAGSSVDLLGNKNSESDLAGPIPATGTTVNPVTSNAVSSTSSPRPTTRVPNIYNVVPGVGAYFRR